jgi:bifunctional non-homologous end joining protein LigD
MALPHIEAAMRLARLRAPFEDPDWLFEIKHDGYRALVYVEDAICRLVSRNGNTFTRWTRLCHEMAAVLAGR